MTRQRALLLDHWPKPDRLAWQHAITPAGLLDEGGAAAHLSPPTQRDLERRYAYFLNWVVNGGVTTGATKPAACVTPASIGGYIEAAAGSLSSVTLAQSLRKIARVASLLDPDRDWRWLDRIVRRLEARMHGADRRPRLVECDRLLKLGQDLMAQAKVDSRLSPMACAILYRDGLMVALLAVTFLRRGNLAALEIDRTFHRDADGWTITIPAAEMKNRKPLQIPVALKSLNASVDQYIETYRPMFRGSATTSRLWLSRFGMPMSESAIYVAVARHTRAAFGKPIGPHLFRHALATTLANHYGSEIGLAAAILGHASPATTERYYNHAAMVDAVRHFQKAAIEHAALAETAEEQ